MNGDVHGHILGSSYNLPVLYSYCTSCIICDVHGEFGLINVHLFDVLPAISSRNVGEQLGNIFCLESLVTLCWLVWVAH